MLGGQALGDLLDLVTHRTRDQRDIASVQGHVAALNAFGGQGAQCAHVLCQTDGGGDFAQLLRGLHVHDLERQTGQRVRLGRAADQTDGHWQLDRADQCAGVVLFPGGERGVVTVAAGIGVRAGFHRAPVVAGGDDDRIDAVHDALVVRGGAVRIDGREGVRVQDAFDDFFTAALFGREGLGGDAHAGTGQAQIGQVRQDAQAHRAAGELFDQWRDRLGHGVDGVRAHGVAHVDDQVHDDHRAAWRVGEHVDFDVLATAAQTNQHLVAAVGHRQDLVACLEQGQTGAVWIAHADDLHLCAHQRLGARGLETTVCTGQLGHVRGGGNDGGLFDRQRDQHVATVDLEVAGHAHGQLERADDVLDHAVGQGVGQRARLRHQGAVFGAQVAGVGDEIPTLGRVQGAEIGEARVDGHVLESKNDCSTMGQF